MAFLDTASKVIQTVAIDFAASGDNTVFSTTAGKVFVVYQLEIIAASAVNAIFKSGASNALSGAMPVPTANPPLSFRNSGFPVFRGEATGEDFKINLSGAVAVDGFCTIAEVDL